MINCKKAIKNLAKYYKKAMSMYGEALMNGRGYTCA